MPSGDVGDENVRCEVQFGFVQYPPSAGATVVIIDEVAIQTRAQS